MFLIVGYIIILGASLGTYAVHGSLAAGAASAIGCMRGLRSR